jgi:hypothetical protein
VFERVRERPALGNGRIERFVGQRGQVSHVEHVTTLDRGSVSGLRDLVHVELELYGGAKTAPRETSESVEPQPIADAWAEIEHRIAAIERPDLPTITHERGHASLLRIDRSRVWQHHRQRGLSANDLH